MPRGLASNAEVTLRDYPLDYLSKPWEVEAPSDPLNRLVDSLMTVYWYFVYIFDEFFPKSNRDVD